MKTVARKADANSWTRRDWLRVGSVAAAAGLARHTPVYPAPAAAAGLPVRGKGPDVYTRIGVRPFISCTATTTINGGSSQLPEVVEALYEAAHYHVNLDELMAKAGPRIAELLGSEAAMVSSGAAGAVTCGTLACITGGDPEKIRQLPDTTGLKNEVVVPRWSRSIYDHAVRSTGVRMVEVETLEDLERACGPKTAMATAQSSILWRPEHFTIDQLVAVARERNIPVLIDDAGALPVPPHPVLSRGADLVAHSGGKVIRGPQSAGLLLGRKDLIQAAWTNSAPHHGFARGMKVSKEEIIGMLTAVESLVNERDPKAEEEQWLSWYDDISERVSQLPGVSTKIETFDWERFGYHPRLRVEWDPQKIGLTAADVHRILLEGEPRIMTPPGGDETHLIIRCVAMYPGEHRLVAERLHEVFQAAPKPKPPRKPIAPAADLTGHWDVEIKFSAGSTRHRWHLAAKGNAVSGVFIGRITDGELHGSADGDEIKLRSSSSYEGAAINYEFRGSVRGERMQGEVDLGEYGQARWQARRQT